MDVRIRQGREKHFRVHTADWHSLLPPPATKADTIAHRTARTITERMDEDPVFYLRLFIPSSSFWMPARSTRRHCATC